jgi:chromosome segregation protein
MYFKRLEIHGFKSFAEPVTIEFDRGITCVVGPNGSGKSNICDAIRWVLGAQSAKALRGDKMEDVIFAGSSSRKSRGMAEVTLVIDNSDGALDIDYNEVAITRRMYRSGESEYLINNNPCRMKDIRELTMDTGIGVEGYSIIGQGKISDIISNNTESIREILEETAGIVMYRSKKAEAERKLASASSNMERVGDIIGEIEGRIGGLRSDSEKAAEFLKLRERHRKLEINITLKNIDNIREKDKMISEDLTELSRLIEETGRNKRETSGKISACAARRDELDQRIEEARARQVKIMGEVNALVSRGRVESERLAAIERSSALLEEEISQLEEKIAREENNSRELFQRKRQWDEKLAVLSRELQQKLSSHEAERQAQARAGRELDEKKNDLFELQQKISSKNMEIASIENLEETLNNRREAVLSERHSGEDNSSDSQEMLEAAVAARKELQQREDELKQEREMCRSRRDESAYSERELARRLEGLKIEAGKISSRKKTMEEMESNYEGYNYAVRFIMKQRLEGVDGVVADLLTVPEGMEIAMETALGAKMQNIVCESDDVAKRGVTLLKESRAGRLTFLPVGSVRPAEIRKSPDVDQAPGFCGYGAECVRFDEKYRSIAEYLLGGTLVVDNMDNAVALSKRAGRRYKIVTLEGEIINSRGAITGGQFRNKSANILERKAEIGHLGERLRKMYADVDKITAQLTELRQQEQELAAESSRLDGEISGLERDSFAKDNEITILKTALTDFESSREKWEKELSNIDYEQKNSDTAIARLRGEVADLQQRSDELKRELEEGSEAYESERSRLESVNAEITEARIEVSGCENEKAKADALVERVNESIRSFTEEKERKQKTLTEQKAEKSRLEENRDSGSSEISAMSSEKTAVDEELSKLTAERNSTAAAYEEAQKERDAIERRSLGLSNQKNELDIQRARHETQLENARGKLWDEFEISYMQAMDYRDEDFVVSAAIKENREIKKRLRELGEVNIGAIEEYKTVSERYGFLTAQRDDIEKSMDELNGIISDMDRIIRRKFKDSFDQVVTNFEEVFRELYGGGHARITLGDPGDPFGSDIEITAQPPGKQLKNINLLSGGEKTMTAIALMFAVLKTKPTPCCILDEVEAALDDSNLDIFGNYVRKFQGVQFTLITHQKTTMEHADVMYGITMPESGVSKVYSLRMDSDPEQA